MCFARENLSDLSGRKERVQVYSLSTGQLLWSTTPRGFIQRDPLVHANGDIVFQAGKSSSDGSFEVWSANGTAKAVVDLGPTPASSLTEFALDAAGTTYAVQGKRFFAVDAAGTKRIDLPIPLTTTAGVRLMVGANQTAYVVTAKEIVAIKP